MAIGVGDQQLRPVLVVTGERKRRPRGRRFGLDRQGRDGSRNGLGQFEPGPVGALRLRLGAIKTGTDPDPSDPPVPAVGRALITEKDMQRHRLQQSAGRAIVKTVRRGQHDGRRDQRASAAGTGIGLHLGNRIPGRGAGIDGHPLAGAGAPRNQQDEERRREQRADAQPVQCAVLTRRSAIKRSMPLNQ